MDIKKDKKGREYLSAPGKPPNYSVTAIWNCGPFHRVHK